MDKNNYISQAQAEKSLSYLQQLKSTHQDVTSQIQLMNVFTCIHLMFPEITTDTELQNSFSDFVATVKSSDNDADPLIVLTVIQHFQRLGVDTSESNVLLETMQKELNNQPDSVRTMGRIRVLAKLLNDIGFTIKEAKTTANEKALVQNFESWFTLPETELSNLADLLLVQGQRLTEQDSEILSLIAIAELRNYKVDLGCKLLRVILAYGVISKTTQEALQFIALQRSSKGSYGFLNPFKNQDMPEQQMEKQFTIPFILNVMLLMLSVEDYSNQFEENQHVRCA